METHFVNSNLARINVLKKITKLTSQFHRFRPQSRQNEISDISQGQKCVIQNGNVRFKNFMQMQWSEEKFSKGIVGDKTRLRF